MYPLPTGTYPCGYGYRSVFRYPREYPCHCLDGGGPKKKPKPDRVNIVTESGLEEEISFTMDEADDNCNMYSVENNDSMILYFWLADSATTLHVTNKHDFFEMFTPLQKRC